MLASPTFFLLNSFSDLAPRTPAPLCDNGLLNVKVDVGTTTAAWSRGRELTGGVLRSSPKPDKKQ